MRDLSACATKFVEAGNKVRVRVFKFVCASIALFRAAVCAESGCSVLLL